ncbi:MAG: hypothetical protein U1C59_03210, partial [Methylotenera sp.]|nr:hypothetical protein [Methylotenera sp.]
RESFKGTRAELELLQQATAYTVGEASLIKLSNQATALGVSLEQQAILFSLAEDAGDKFGVGVEEGFSKIINASEGAIRGVKDIGIETKVYNKIVEDLAKAHGDVITNLDPEIQKQIRLQAILQASGQTMDDVTGKIADNADKLQQSKVVYERLNSEIGRTLSTFMLPLISSYTNLIAKVTDLSPLLAGLTGATVTLAISYGALSATGLLPFIFNTQIMMAALRAATLNFHLATFGTTTLTAGLTTARIAVQGFFASLGTIGWAIIGITTLATAFALLSDDTNDAQRAASEQEIQLRKSKEEFKGLIAIIQDTTKEESLRKEAIDKLNKNYPDYIKNTVTLKTTEEELTQILRQGNDEFVKRINLLANQEILQEKLTAAVNKQIEVSNKEAEINKLKWENPQSVEGAKKALEGLKEEATRLSAEAEAFQNKILSSASSGAKDDGLSTIGKLKATLKKDIEDLQTQYDALEKTDKAGMQRIETLINAKRNKLKGLELKDGSDGGGKDDVFNKNKGILAEAQRHQTALLKFSSDNELFELDSKIKHFDEMIALYQKYGQDTVALTNAKIEAMLELEDKRKPKEKPVEDAAPAADGLLKGVVNVEDYIKSIRAQSKQDELNAWYEAEKEKLSLYEENQKALDTLDVERAKRQEELSQAEAEARAATAISAINHIAGAYAKHTVVGKAAAVGMATINTYEAATKALTAGPIIGPILAALITVAGLANVQKILATKTGYASGGRLPAGQSGFIEGYHHELIAPEKTFENIMRYELIPKVLLNAQPSGVNYDFSKIEKKLDNVITAFNDKQFEIDMYQFRTVNKRLDRIESEFKI